MHIYLLICKDVGASLLELWKIGVTKADPLLLKYVELVLDALIENYFEQYDPIIKVINKVKLISRANVNNIANKPTDEFSDFFMGMLHGIDK